jgi:hypothetical protein
MSGGVACWARAGVSMAASRVRKSAGFIAEL